MRRFLRPSFRRPLPDFLVPKAISVLDRDEVQMTDNWQLGILPSDHWPMQERGDHPPAASARVA
jgi:hypothetical protein